MRRPVTVAFLLAGACVFAAACLAGRAQDRDREDRAAMDREPQIGLAHAPGSLAAASALRQGARPSSAGEAHRRTLATGPFFLTRPRPLIGQRLPTPGRPPASTHRPPPSSRGPPRA